jgi:hypothetical protein
LRESVVAPSTTARTAVADEVIRLGTLGSPIQASATYLHGHLNIGYIAHNLMLHGTDYQLVLNPDVEVASDAPRTRSAG